MFLWHRSFCTQVWTCELEGESVFQEQQTELQKKREQENWRGLLFLSSVFFHSSITQCGEGSFPPTHHGCQRGHTQTVRVNTHSLLHTPTLTHALTRTDVGKGHSTYTHSLSITYRSLLGCVFFFFFWVLFSLTTAFDFLKCFLCFYFTWTGSLLAKRLTNSLSVKLYFVHTVQFHCKNIWWWLFKTKYTQRKTLSPWLLLLCLQPSSSSSSSSELLLVPSFLFRLPRMPCRRRRSGSMSWRGRWGRAWTRLHIGRLSGRKRRVPVFRPRDRFNGYFTHRWRLETQRRHAHKHTERVSRQRGLPLNP